MASKKYLNLDEAAAQLGIKKEELNRLREKGEVRGFADRGTWKFKAEDIDELARRRQFDSDPELPMIDDDNLLHEESGGGRDRGGDHGNSSTVIRRGGDKGSDSDVRLKSAFDLGLGNLKDQLTGSSADMPIVMDPQPDSDVRLRTAPSGVAGRSGGEGGMRPAKTGKIPVAGEDDSASDVALSGGPRSAAKPGSDSDVQLASKSKPGSDSDVRLAASSSAKLDDGDDVTLLPAASTMMFGDFKAKTPESASDVALAPSRSSDPGKPGKSSGSGKSARPGSDSDVSLLPSSSTGRMKREQQSDSDVAISPARSSGAARAPIDTGSDSDVAFLPSSATGKIPLDLGSDSDVTLLPPGGKGDSIASAMTPSRGTPPSRAADPNSIRLDVDVDFANLSDADASVLSDESPVRRRSEDSGIALDSGLDSGIGLARGDSGISLERGDSGLSLLPDDSGLRLLGSSDARKKGSSSHSRSGDSGLRLAANSGVQLERPNDSGIALDALDSKGSASSGRILGGDSGITLRAPSGDSGITLRSPTAGRGADSGITLRSSGKAAGDSGIRLLDADDGLPMLASSGTGKRAPKASGPRAGSGAEDIDATSPMLLLPDDDEGSSDQIGTDPEVPMLGVLEDDEDASSSELSTGDMDTAVIMFDDEEDVEQHAAMIRKKKEGEEEVEEEEAEFDEEDFDEDELDEDDDEDVFDAEDADFEEEFARDEDEDEEGELSEAELAVRYRTAPDVEWGVGPFLLLSSSCLVMIVGAVLGVDLLRTVEASGGPVYSGDLITFFAGLF